LYMKKQTIVISNGAVACVRIIGVRGPNGLPPVNRTKKPLKKLMIYHTIKKTKQRIRALKEAAHSHMPMRGASDATHLASVVRHQV